MRSQIFLWQDTEEITLLSTQEEGTKYQSHTQKFGRILLPFYLNVESWGVTSFPKPLHGESSQAEF
jgi:hypothetical protein